MLFGTENIRQNENYTYTAIENMTKKGTININMKGKQIVSFDMYLYILIKNVRDGWENFLISVELLLIYCLTNEWQVAVNQSLQPQGWDLVVSSRGTWGGREVGVRCIRDEYSQSTWCVSRPDLKYGNHYYICSPCCGNSIWMVIKPVDIVWVICGCFYQSETHLFMLN